MTLWHRFQEESVSDSSNNLKLVNAIIAMCRIDSRWPHYFYDMGYGVKWVEYPFTCHTGETVVPDLIVTSAMQNNCILFESKSGNNIENEQAKRYMKVKPEDVVSKLHVDTREGKEPDVDITYICFSESSSNIVEQLNNLSAEFPVLEMSIDTIKLVNNSFSVSQLNEDLSKGLPINRNKIPMGYFPFDDKSSNSQIAPFVVRTLVAFARQNKPQFTSEEITRDIIGSLWEHFGDQKKREIINKVSAILGKAKVKELRDFLKRTEGYWTLSYDFPASKVFPTRRLEAISKRCKQFVKRLRNEERAGGYQLPLIQDF